MTFLNEYSGFRLLESRTVVAKCLKLISNHLGIISGTYFSLFLGSLIQRGPQEGSETIFWPSFGILNEFPQFFFN